jgi:hypothetical protein
MDGVLVLIPIVCSLGLFTMITVIAIAWSSSKKQQTKIRADVQNRLIDKFGSAPEFIAFLSSPQGREFMGGFESAPRLMARERILRGIKSATVLSCLGLAFSVMSFWVEKDLIVPGLILLALGGGYIVSSILTAKLSKSWGLLDDPRHDTSLPTSVSS